MDKAESEIVLRFDSVISKDRYEEIPILDEQKIAEIISRAPNIFVLFEQRISALEQERFQLHQEFKREKARKILAARKLKGEDKLTNAIEREAWALLQTSVIESMDKEVACVSELKQVKAQYEGWKAAFIAARKLETRVQQANQIEIQSGRYVT